ncbi:MAG: thiamine phosphate synthase [Methyloligellaceae bacterium]
MMLHKFYPIVPDYPWLARIVPAGIKTIQLRLKDADQAEILQQIEQSLKLCRDHDCQLIVNDYWQEAIQLGADYIHLGQEDLEAADLPTIKAAGLKLGLSSHSHEELDIAIAADPEYIALGPVYETTLKKMKWSPQGLDRLSEWKSRISCPLVAIGGITLERSNAVWNAGADSIAVVTDIIANPDPEKRIKEWLDSVRDL